uniref:Activin_recp domain-containing protein n=1 Tax=Strongyloides papillosus TaxID=174720 RepID=A0A0N5B518_STREA
MDKVKESMKTKNKLKNCGNYPCFKAFFELEYNETKESVSLDVSDCLVDSPCDVSSCKEDYCNMSLRTRYNIGSIMPVVILGLILIKGLNA